MGMLKEYLTSGLNRFPTESTCVGRYSQNIAAEVMPIKKNPASGTSVSRRLVVFLFWFFFYSHCEEKQNTWTIISSSMRSVQLILSMTWSEPLYSMTAFPTFISLLNMLTTNSPLSRNSPRLFDMAAGGGNRKDRIHNTEPKLSLQT